MGVSWGPLGGILGPLGTLLGVSWGVLGAGSSFSAVLGRTWRVLGASLGPLGGVLGPSWAVLATSWGPLGASWRPLGASWRPRPTRSEGELFFGGLLGPSWAHFWEVLDGFWDDFSILFLSYRTRSQHVVKPQKYYICSTGEPFQALRGQYFSSTFKYFRGL